MNETRRTAPLAVAMGLALLAGTRTSPAATQASSEAARAKKSVYGKLESVDQSLNGLFMRTDDGKRLAWRFEPDVIAETAKIPLGNPVIVIYRQVSEADKRVTAVAFPGTAQVPTYVNLTGWRVSIHSAPMVGGACAQPKAEEIQQLTIPVGGMAEIAEACWCCAAADEACAPTNKTGVGRALLVACFE